MFGTLSEKHYLCNIFIKSKHERTRATPWSSQLSLKGEEHRGSFRFDRDTHQINL